MVTSHAMRSILIAIFSLLLAGGPVRATHIAGGEMSYKWTGGNDFEVTLRLYRDCLTGSAAFDPSIVIGIFDLATNLRTDTLQMFLQRVDTVELEGPSGPCAFPPDVCIEIGTYVDTIAIPDNAAGYYVSWERCCRNLTVVNLQNPLQTGFAFYMEMPDPALQNSSPAFTDDPLPFVCEGQPLDYSMMAVDPDGDVLVYELSDPLAGNLGFPTSPQPQAIAATPGPAPYSPIVWAPGYSLANVCGSNNTPLTVNASTGEISVVADAFGLYAMAVTVREYRNGVQIGMVRREIEFAVIVCLSSLPQNSVSLVQGTGSGYPVVQSGNNYEIYETDTLCMLYQGTDNDDSLWLEVSSELLPGGPVGPPYASAPGDTGLYTVTSLFCWETACGQAGQQYYVAYKLSDNGCPLPQTRRDTVFITVKTPPVDSTLVLLCLGLQNDDSVKVQWTSFASIPPRYFSRYEIYRSKNGGPFTLLASLTDPALRSFTDNAAPAHTTNDYCYFIRAVSVCGETGLHSDTLCTISQLNGKVNFLKQVSVTGPDAVEVTWKHFPLAPQSVFYVFRKEDVPGAKFSLHATLPFPASDSWTDRQVDPSSDSYCYYIVNEDQCGNVSEKGNEGCSILLDGESGFHESRLSWSAYREYLEGVQDYRVYRKPVEKPSFEGLAVVADSTLEYADRELDLGSGLFYYYVEAVEDSGGLGGVSRSNEILLHQQPIGFLPSAFTPNGDGRNDIWKLESSYIREVAIRVYSRWGSLVYASDNKNEAWNGTDGSTPVPAGTYVYTIRFTGYDREEPYTDTGTVTLIR